jgi:O-methyltransferase involved in polyketide biosynthesis
MAGSTAISPTAHYTGYVWARNGLSPRELATIEGRVLFESLHPVMAVSAALGGPSLESYLLARHRAIDALLTRAIEDHAVTLVIELAAGMSPRGWRFTERYGDRIEYVEADLAEMAARKRRALDRLGSLSERHRVLEVDALSDAGPVSLAAMAAGLDHGRGLAIITEGLLGYLPTDTMEDLWRRIAGVLAGFAHGRYISDLHLESARTPAVRAFALLLSAFVRRRVHLHFSGAEQARSALLAAGFSSAAVHRAVRVTGEESGGGAGLADILEASIE